MSECPRCGASTYAADRVEGLGREWHKACLVCDACGCKLNPAIPGLLVELQGKPYCKACAKKGGAGASIATPGAPVHSTAASTPVAPAWTAAAAPDFYGKVGTESEPAAAEPAENATPTPASKPCSPPAAPSPDAKSSARDLASRFGALSASEAPKPVAKPAQSPSFARAGAAPASPAEATPKPAVWTAPQPPPLPPPPARSASAVAAPATVAKPAPKFGGGASCGRCAKTVYAAEKVTGPGGVDWHRACLTCLSCKRGLTSGAWLTHKDTPTGKTEAYCSTCHARQFGPRGVRGGADGGMLTPSA